MRPLVKTKVARILAFSCTSIGFVSSYNETKTEYYSFGQYATMPLCTRDFSGIGLTQMAPSSFLVFCAEIKFLSRTEKLT